MSPRWRHSAPLRSATGRESDKILRPIASAAAYLRPTFDHAINEGLRGPIRVRHSPQVELERRRLAGQGRGTRVLKPAHVGCRKPSGDEHARDAARAGCANSSHVESQANGLPLSMQSSAAVERDFLRHACSRGTGGLVIVAK